jgi:sphinganine-1-phosphate aldolase
MLAMGEDGYVEMTRRIMETTREIAEGVQRIDGLSLLGQAEAMIVCFSGCGVNVYMVSDAMQRKGWLLNSLQSPPSVHLCVTGRHYGQSKAFIDDLTLAVAEVRASPGDGGRTASVYGATASLPPGPVNELLAVYNDVLLDM